MPWTDVFLGQGMLFLSLDYLYVWPASSQKLCSGLPQTLLITDLTLLTSFAITSKILLVRQQSNLVYLNLVKPKHAKLHGFGSETVMHEKQIRKVDQPTVYV